MLDFFESFNTVSIDLAEIVELVLQGEVLGSFEDLRCDIVSIIVKHNFLEQLSLFRRVLHKYNAKLFKLLFWHSLNSFFNDS